LSLIERQPYGSSLAERDFRIAEGEKIRELGKADKQVDKMLLALPSRWGDEVGGEQTSFSAFWYTSHPGPAPNVNHHATTLHDRY